MENHYNDSELEEIRRKKLEELRKQIEEEQKRKEILKLILTPSAYERLMRIKFANPRFYLQVENVLISLYYSGRIKKKIDEESLKRILDYIYSKTHREPRIIIKRK